MEKDLSINALYKIVSEVQLMITKYNTNCYKHIFIPNGYELRPSVLRITQAIVSEINVEISKRFSHLSEEQSCLKAIKINLFKKKIKGIKIEPHTGKSKVSFYRTAKNIIKMYMYTAYIVFSFIKSRLRGSKYIKSALILYGIPDQDLFYKESTKRFDDFCRNGPLDILRNSNTLCIQSTRKNFSNIQCEEHFLLGRDPLVTLFCNTKFTIKEIGLYVFNQFVFASKMSLFFLRYPIFSLLWRDFGAHQIANFLSFKKVIEGVFFTSSNYEQQWLWSVALPGRTFETVLVAYGQNTRPFIDKDNPIRTPLPTTLQIQVDKLYVWNQGYKNLLIEDGIRIPIIPVGPVLWYLPEKRKMNYIKEKSSRSKYRIVVFDVWPLNPKGMKRLGFKSHYYNLSNLNLFLDDILLCQKKISVAYELNIELLIKQKREVSDLQDELYGQRIDRLALKQSKIQRVSFEENLYDLIESGDIVISLPFTSPAYVAETMNVPALFYDPTGSICNIGCYPNIPLISSRDSLENFIKNCLVRRDYL